MVAKFYSAVNKKGDGDLPFNHVLPRPNRLSESQAIVNVMKRGHTLTHGALRFRFFQSRNSPPRIAIIVSLKVSKRAVVRNRLKRQLHAIVASLLPIFVYSIDGALSAQPGLEDQSFKELTTVVTILFKRARLVP